MTSIVEHSLRLVLYQIIISFFKIMKVTRRLLCPNTSHVQTWRTKAGPMQVTKLMCLSILSNIIDPPQVRASMSGGESAKGTRHKISKAIFFMWLIWQFTVIIVTINLSSQVHNRKLGIMDVKMVLTFKLYDWLMSKIRDVSRTNYVTCLFIRRFLLFLFYYKSSHLVLFEGNLSLDFQIIT